MKPTTLIFYADDGDAAKGRAHKVRTEGGNAQIRQMIAYGGETEPCEAVVVMPDVSDADRDRIAAAHGDKVNAPKPKLTLPPPPAAPAGGKNR